MPHRKPVIPGAHVLGQETLLHCDIRAQVKVRRATRAPPLYNCPFGDPETPFVMRCRNLFDEFYREEVEIEMVMRLIERGATA
jgi:hypothetical protein